MAGRLKPDIHCILDVMYEKGQRSLCGEPSASAPCGLLFTPDTVLCMSKRSKRLYLCRVCEKRFGK